MLEIRFQRTMELIEEAADSQPSNDKLLWALPKKRRPAWWRKLAKALGGELESHFEPQASTMEGGMGAAKIKLGDQVLSIESYSKFQRFARAGVADKKRHRQNRDYQFWIGLGDKHEEFTAAGFAELVNKAKKAVTAMRKASTTPI